MVERTFRERSDDFFESVAEFIGGAILLLLIGAFYVGLAVIFIAALVWAVNYLR